MYTKTRFSVFMNKMLTSKICTCGNEMTEKQLNLKKMTFIVV
jgi:hypothetical protein